MKRKHILFFILSITQVLWAQKIGTKIITPFGTARSISVLADNRIFVGTQNDGLYYSPDNGSTWIYLTFPHSLTGMAYKSSSGNLYVDAQYNGLYRSKGGTGNWELVGFQDVEIDQIFESATGNLVCHINAYNPAVYNSVYTFYLSKNNGLNWNYIPSQFSKSLGLGIAVHPNKTIYIGTYQGLYKSTDGESWQFCEPGTVYSTAIQSNGLIYYTTSNEIRNTMDNGSALGIFPLTQSPFVTYKIVRDQQDDLYVQSTNYSESYLYKNTKGSFIWNLLGELNGDNGHTYGKQMQINSFGDIFYLDGGSLYKINRTITKVDDYLNVQVPHQIQLFQNYPNPFNPTTNISFSLNEKTFMKLKIYDSCGKEITTLVNEEKPAGTYSVKFDGNSLSSGVYFYRLQTSHFSQTMKLLLLK
ncbi:MAG: T9SS type A sorting domain-containing protein [Ignavibacteriales bacterium]|nr:T9SS type A sorting domain-containing protein [Ignavibacteriales bacterium]